MERFTKEFKRDAVALVLSSGRPIIEVARELGINDTTLGGWVRVERKKRGLPPAASSGDDAELEENKRLKRRVAELEKEREILKRATVFWVKESNGGEFKRPLQRQPHYSVGRRSPSCAVDEAWH